MELNCSVAAGQAHSHSRKFVFACQTVGGKVTPRPWNSSLVSAASPHVVSLSAAHINILWRSSQCVYQKKWKMKKKKKKLIGICGGKFHHPDICHSCPFHLLQERLHCCWNHSAVHLNVERLLPLLSIVIIMTHPLTEELILASI